jgi:RimJ/RimL family protein N-acetyltransferase
MVELRSRRLRLRAWRAADLAPFAAINADLQVVEHLPGVLSQKESDAMAERIANHFVVHGFGLWAVEVPGVAPFIGYIGLSLPTFEAPFTPCVEIGWRLDSDYWGQGYATEGATAALAHGFGELGLAEIVSFTVPANLRSRRVMERLDMQRDAADDFDHPLYAPGHRLRRHVLYRLTRERWMASH